MKISIWKKTYIEERKNKFTFLSFFLSLSSLCVYILLYKNFQSILLYNYIRKHGSWLFCHLSFKKESVSWQWRFVFKSSPGVFSEFYRCSLTSFDKDIIIKPATRLISIFRVGNCPIFFRMSFKLHLIRPPLNYRLFFPCLYVTFVQTSRRQISCRQVGLIGVFCLQCS